jgi:tape measure domain-containing protein
MARVARLGVVIDSSGAKRGADETNTALNGMSSTALRAQRAIVQAMSAIGAAMGIREVVQLADSWTRLEGRLKTVTTSAAELATVQRQLVAVANTTRTGIEETITLYTRLARTAGELGMSQSDVVRLTDLTAKTLVVSGTSATQASGALLQFSQALGGGVVRAEEFNSILEGTPVIVQEVAKSMGLTVAELRRLVIAGEVTSQQFAEAFLDATGRINDSFSELGPTVEGALTQLSNAFAEAIGRGNAAGGATQELAAAIIELAAMIRENQATFDAMGEALATMLRWGTAAADAFIKAGDAVDRLGDYIAGAAKATEGLANFDTKPWTEGITMMTKANAEYEATVRRVGRALVTTRKEASGMSSEGAAFMRNLTGGGMGGSLSATPFGMMGGLGGGAAAASRARVAPAAKADADAMRDAARAAKELQEALDKTAFSSGLARERALENANALRQFVQPVKLTFAEVMNLIQAQERAANVAEAHAAAVRLGIADTIAYKAEVMTAAQVEDLRAQGISLTTEQLERLAEANRRVVAAQSEGGSSPVAATEDWANSIRDLIGVVQLLGQAFGDVGRTVSGIGTGAQSIVSGLQRASQIKNAQGQAVGIGGALSGAAGVAGVVSGLGAAGAVVGGLVQIGDALDVFGRKAKERAREIAEATKRFNEGIAEFRTQALGQGSGVGSAIQQASRELQALIAEAQKAFRGSALNRETSRVQGLYDATLDRIAGDFFTSIEDAFDRLNGNELAINIRRAGEELRERENAIMALRKSGAITAEEEAAALVRIKDLYDQTVASMEAAAAAAAAAADAERKRREEEQARARTAFGLDLTQRRQTLNGDSRGAFITGQTIANNAALASAQELVEAGTITQQMFDDLKVLLGDELVAALKAFDEAAAEAKVQTMEDLEVRALVAQGRTAEAEQRRIEIANRRELLGVTDEATRAEILRVQAIEEAGRIAAAAAEAERVRQEQNADIDRRLIDVYKILDPAKAKELEQRQKEIDRTNELKNAADDATRARLQELYAMEDAAEAAVKLAKAQEEQARIAEELASFTSSLNVQYLRSQGRGFDADVAELDEWRTEQRKRASSIGAGPDAFAQIDAIYASRYNDLVKRSMGMNDPIQTPELTPSQTDSTVLGEETIAVRSARSITESTALQLVDYSASQLAVQREILAEIRGRRSEGGALLASPSLDLMERQLGQRANTAAMLLGGSVR